MRLSEVNDPSGIAMEHASYPVVTSQSATLPSASRVTMCRWSCSMAASRSAAAGRAAHSGASNSGVGGSVHQQNTPSAAWRHVRMSKAAWIPEGRMTHRLDPSRSKCSPQLGNDTVAAAGTYRPLRTAERA